MLLFGLENIIFDFIARFEDHSRCYELIEYVRWPNGFCCPRCHGLKHYRLKHETLMQCANSACRYQCSLTAGTIFHGSKVHITKWFMAIFYVCNNTGGVSALALKKLIGVSYKTASRMLRKIRRAMHNANERRLVNTLFYAIKALIEPKKIPTAKSAVLVQVESGLHKIQFADPANYRNVSEETKVPAGEKVAHVVASAITHLSRMLLGTYHRYCHQSYWPLYVAEFVYRFNEPNPEVMIRRLLEDCIFPNGKPTQPVQPAEETQEGCSS